MRCALQGLLEFLAYEPFYDSRIWSSLVLRRGEAVPERLAPLCSLLQGVMLRRTKDSVGAPRQAPPLRAPCCCNLCENCARCIHAAVPAWRTCNNVHGHFWLTAAAHAVD